MSYRVFIFFLLTLFFCFLNIRSYSQNNISVLNEVTKFSNKKIICVLKDSFNINNNFFKKKKTLNRNKSHKVLADLKLFLKDTSNFYMDDLMSSCTFVPNKLIAFNSNKIPKFYFILSKSCDVLLYSVNRLQNIKYQFYLTISGQIKVNEIFDKSY